MRSRFLKCASALFLLALVSAPALAEPKDGPLSIDVVKLKAKGSWTEVQLAIRNNGDTDASFQCCTVFLENTDGYAVASLDQGEVRSQIHNKARTGAIIGEIIGAGLGIGGLASGNSALGYSGLGVAGGSAIAGVVGDSAADSQERNLVIDDIMRNRVFPSGLKVAGVAYFPPKKKWPGSQHAQEIHLTYKMGNRTYRTSAPVTN